MIVLRLFSYKSSSSIDGGYIRDVTLAIYARIALVNILGPLDLGIGLYILYYKRRVYLAR